MIQSGAKLVFFTGGAEFLYQDLGAKPVHTAGQLWSWKMECWATGESLPYDPEKFIAKKSIITKLVDSYVDNKK